MAAGGGPWRPDGFAVHCDSSMVKDACAWSVGRTVWRDVGSTALAFRLMMKVVDYNLMAVATAVAAPLMPDFQRQVT